jgi:hypothetical protein
MGPAAAGAYRRIGESIGRGRTAARKSLEGVATRANRSICSLPRRGDRTQPGVLTPGPLFEGMCPENGTRSDSFGLIDNSIPSPSTFWRHLQGASGGNTNPGLKPRAESFRPFGAESRYGLVKSMPMSTIPVRCIYVIEQPPALNAT